MKAERLDKIIATQFNISRSEARIAIRRGKVCVNEEVCRDFSAAFSPKTDKFSLNGITMEYRKHVYLVMNKPSGVVSASEDKKAKTVVDLVEGELKRPGLFPVGRLDKTTTGLIILTDDGAFGHKVISPKSNIPKTYIVGLDGDVSEEICRKFGEGIILASGELCKPAKCERTGDCEARVTITEGKYHQIKRMFGTFGLGVNTLRRESIGKLVLPDDLAEGEYREYTYDLLNFLIM